MSLSIPNTCRTDTFMSGKPVTSCAAAAIVPPWPRTTRGAIDQPCVSDIRLQATRKPVRCDSRCGRWQISQFFMDLDTVGGSAQPIFKPRISRLRRRAFELDAVAFGVGEIHRRPLPIRAEARFLRPAVETLGGEMRLDRRRVERRNAQAQMVEI